MRSPRFLLPLLLSFITPLFLFATDPSCEKDSNARLEQIRSMSSDELLHLEQSAIAGDPDAQLDWGRTFQFGIGKPASGKTARVWFTKSAEAGNCLAQQILAAWTMPDIGPVPDPKESYKWNLKLAERGLWTSQVNVGSMLSNGIGVEKDEKKGFEWLLRAADENNAANAQLAVANAYMNGRGTDRDLDKAEAYARRAADQGLTIANLLLTSIQQKRSSVPAVNVDATRKMADQGDALAQYSLGMLYRTGREVPRDDVLAFKYLSLAAAQELPAALSALGEMYERGEGVQQSYEVAAKLYQASADDVRTAQYRLGELYYKGLGVESDPISGYMWIAIAARRGDKVAQARKTELESQLKPEEKTAGEQAVKAFFAANPDQDKDMGEGEYIKAIIRIDEPEKKPQ